MYTIFSFINDESSCNFLLSKFRRDTQYRQIWGNVWTHVISYMWCYPASSIETCHLLGKIRCCISLGKDNISEKGTRLSTSNPKYDNPETRENVPRFQTSKEHFFYSHRENITERNEEMKWIICFQIYEILFSI